MVLAVGSSMSSQQHPRLASKDNPSVDSPLFADAEAALQETRAVVGRKWHPVILLYLMTEGPLGFSDLKARADGISSKMLSESLSDLQADDLVCRTLFDQKPVRVEYSLTERGHALTPVIEAMVDWGVTEVRR